jgi:hypothetical protein
MFVSPLVAIALGVTWPSRLHEARAEGGKRLENFREGGADRAYDQRVADAIDLHVSGRCLEVQFLRDAHGRGVSRKRTIWTTGE